MIIRTQKKFTHRFAHNAGLQRVCQISHMCHQVFTCNPSVQVYIFIQAAATCLIMQCCRMFALHECTCMYMQIRLCLWHLLLRDIVAGWQLDVLGEFEWTRGLQRFENTAGGKICNFLGHMWRQFFSTIVLRILNMNQRHEFFQRERLTFRKLLSAGVLRAVFVFYRLIYWGSFSGRLPSICRSLLRFYKNLYIILCELWACLAPRGGGLPLLQSHLARPSDHPQGMPLLHSDP